MSDYVRIHPEITKAQAEKLKVEAKQEHRTLQGQVGHILDLYLTGQLVKKEVTHA